MDKRVRFYRRLLGSFRSWVKIIDWYEDTGCH